MGTHFPALIRFKDDEDELNPKGEGNINLYIYKTQQTSRRTLQALNFS